MRSRPLGLLAALALLSPLALGGCSGDDDAPTPQEPTSSAAPVETPPLLEAAWEQDLGGVSFVQPAVVGEVLLVRDGGSVSGFDTASGEPLWDATLPPGLEVCQVAEQSGADGLVGVLLRGRRRPCTVVAALDTTTGRLAWTREVPGEPPYHEGRAVATGATTVAATFFCDEMRRFRLTDGEPLGVIGPRDRKCAMDTVTDGSVVFRLDDPETAETPDDYGTGFIPPSDQAGAFELLDLDSGERIWRRPLETTRGASALAVLSSTGPTTVLALREQDQLTMRVVDARGRPGPYLGRRLGSDLPRVVGEGDGVLVLRYPDEVLGRFLFGYDETTGEELWRLPHVGAAEVTEDGLVLATDVTVPGSLSQTWLTRVQLRDPDAVEALGSLPGAGALLVGGLVLGQSPEPGARGLSAYVLPTEGEDRVYDVPPAPEDEGRWGEDDLRPEDVVMACDALSDETLALLGLDDRRLPRPADCRWSETGSPPYLTQRLGVTVSAVAPRASYDDPDASLTGAEVATEQVEDYYDDVEPLDLPGLGEQVWAQLSDPGLGGKSLRLVVRWRNVIVDVSGAQDVRVSDRRYAAVPDDQVDAAVVAAVADVLEDLGAPVEDRTVAEVPASDVVVPDVCRTLRAEAARLVPGVRPSGQTPADQTRQSACVWWSEREDAPSLEAMVHVVPPSPVGLSAEEAAQRLVAGGYARLRALPGLPGVRARIIRYAEDDYRSARIYAVAGDTVVEADLTDRAGGLTRAEADRVVVRLLRTLLGSVER